MKLQSISERKRRYAGYDCFFLPCNFVFTGRKGQALQWIIRKKAIFIIVSFLFFMIVPSFFLPLRLPYTTSQRAVVCASFCLSQWRRSPPLGSDASMPDLAFQACCCLCAFESDRQSGSAPSAHLSDCRTSGDGVSQWRLFSCCAVLALSPALLFPSGAGRLRLALMPLCLTLPFKPDVASGLEIRQIEWRAWLFACTERKRSACRKHAGGGGGGACGTPRGVYPP